VSGTLLFTLENNFFMGLLGRFILGCGSAFAFIGAVTFIRKIFFDNYFALLVAIVISVGTISGALGQVFAVQIIHYLSWHFTIGGMAIWGCFLALAFVCVPSSSFEETKSNKSKKKLSTLLQELRFIIKNRELWINGLVGGIFYFPTSVIAATWGVEFFKKAFQLSDALGSVGVTFLFIGWSIGGPVFSFLACRYRLEKFILSAGAILSAIILIILLAQKSLMPGQIFFLLWLFGFFSGAQVVVWRIFTNLVPNVEWVGSASALTNLVIMLTVAIADLFLGKLINIAILHFSDHIGGLLGIDLRVSLYLLPLLLLTIPLLLLLLKKTEN
jgi:predicted MFS family arabinose efflux permease